MSSEIGVIAKYSGIILAALASAFGIGKYNSTVVKKCELYNSDGSQIYYTAKEAHEKFERIVGYLEKQNEESKDIREFMGSVKRYMDNNR